MGGHGAADSRVMIAGEGADGLATAVVRAAVPAADEKCRAGVQVTAKRCGGELPPRFRGVGFDDFSR